MSSPLSYLTVHKLKNTFLQIVKKPVYIVYLVVIAALIFITVKGGKEGFDASRLRDPMELFSIINILLVFIFSSSVLSGFSSGGTFFSLQDVHLVFTSPIRQTKILMYGLLSQAKNSILIGIFILFQYTSLHTFYGLSYWGILLLLLVYAANFFLSQVIALTIYCATSNDEKKKSLLKAVVWAVIGSYLLGLCYLILKNQDLGIVGAGVKAIGTIGGYFPVSGWLCYLFNGIAFGPVFQSIFALGACVVTLIVLIIALEHIQPDFYEDVLQTAETTYSAALASKSGRVAEAAPKNVKLGKTGLHKGFGADAFYYKHLIENRRAKVLILTPFELMFLVMTGIFCFFMRNTGSESSLISVLAFSTYMQIFTVSMGRMVRELCKPWVYLVPEPPFRKLLWTMAETLRSSVVESVIFTAVICLILGLEPLMWVSLFLFRYTFTLVFLSGNVLMQKLFGSLNSKVLTIVFFVIIILLMAVPGVGLGILCSIWIKSMTIFLICMAVGNVLASALVLFLSRNLFSQIEFNL